jgi:hypothetical protein
MSMVHTTAFLVKKRVGDLPQTGEVGGRRFMLTQGASWVPDGSRPSSSDTPENHY